MSAFPSSLPQPRTPDAKAAPPLRWGVLGTGWIAARFTASLISHTRQQVYAVGSRSLATAESFVGSLAGSVEGSAGWSVEGLVAGSVAGSPGRGAMRGPAAYGSYEALVADPAVDVVYVATPHHLHHEHARLALEAGKPVVVEKPMGLDAGECRDLAALAAERRLFLMEAMWTLFLPKFDVIRQLLDAGALGTVHTVLADLGEHFGPEHRILRADLAGGPMYDLGTYPVTLATWVLGEPDEVAAVGTVAPAELSPSRVDGQTAIVMRTASGGVAALHTSLLGASPTTAAIVGSEATLTIDGPFYQPGGFTLASHDGRVLRYDEAQIGHAGLHWEAAEAARRISAGETKSPLRPLADTVATMRVMDLVAARLSR